ncbi:hypothetical protein AX16_003714 [Volvariella volvacea WC 439]|nr:hypothetical protein AX16_003714 [Volvariella volvacea WC 439]
MPSHGLLLRLFLSPSFFSVHVALHYLQLYADNIGITYYLTRRLKELDTHELRDVWGFICHLLVSRPSKSRALECFVVEIAQRSTHIAMITLWFMQAALKDLSPSGHHSQSFLICQHVLHKCHEIIFGDPPPPISAPYSALTLSLNALSRRTKIRHHVEPTLVGLGVVLAGVPVMPQLTAIVGEVALEQGRAEEAGGLKSFQQHEEKDVSVAVPQTQPEEPEDEVEEETSPSPASTTDATTAAPGVVDRRRTIDAAQTVPALPLHLRDVPKSRASEDPLGQLDAETTPYQSSPSIPTSSSRPMTRHLSVDTPDNLLLQYDTPSQIQLLRGHYCHSEVQFILSLENICNRLLVVPRPARVSALRAELTALNHKLPAEVCMPMWCASYDKPKGAHNMPHPHHRIVRIPPGESVVLNSAERAPYLLLIEVLNDDLDFDPSKRTNKDVLRKIVAKEHQKKGASRDLVPFGSASYTTALPDNSDIARSITNAQNDASIVVIPPTPSTAELPVDEEEVDLVEQVYGPDQDFHGPVDLSESIVLPPAPTNRELEIAAWSRSSSLPATPMSNPSASFPSPNSPFAPQLDSNNHVLSLDEYSERMRTAAIMLAQLNASLTQVAPTAMPQKPTELPAPTTSRGWLPSTSWLTGASSTPSSRPQTPGKGPVHPSLVPPESSHAAPSHTRLQHAEATAIKERIMKEMLALEEERMQRTRADREEEQKLRVSDLSGAAKSQEDENIIRRELNKADPSAVVFSESWAAKKARIRSGSPYGHLANWDCISVIVKTGGDLRQEQLAVQLIREFQRIWEEENCACWVRYFRILITGGNSGLVETITDAVSIHSIKKAEYARRLAEGRLGHVTLMDHFISTYGDPSSAKFARAQRNFAKSLAGYSVVTYLLQVKDRHNGNILLDREGHLIHIDFGFILSNSPGNIGFEAAPFKLPFEYIEVLGGVTGQPFLEFKKLFKEGFEVARKHCDRIITLVELMQKDSNMPCFAAFGEQTAHMLRERFQPSLTHSLVGEYVERLIDSSLGSHWTRLYDTYQYYSQSIL